MTRRESYFTFVFVAALVVLYVALNISTTSVAAAQQEQAGAAAGGTRQAQQWEYKMEIVRPVWDRASAGSDIFYGRLSEARLNELGADRWELVTTMVAPDSPNVYLFKRPK